MLAYLSFGANIGDREGTIGRALKLVAASPGLQLVRVSSFYATEPVGYLDQPEFINCAAVVESSLSPDRLLGRLRAIERRLGRKSRQKWHEREIDIDILLFGDAVVDTPDLRIPHPEMQNRGFVLHPLAEIAPEAVHPLLGVPVAELLARLHDSAAVHPMRVAGSDRPPEHPTP